jgi:multiubiquitin
MADEHDIEGRQHHGREHDERHEIFIHIDHHKYEIRKHELTGKQIREIPKPPIGSDYDLFLETRGPGDDRKIRDEEEVRMRDGESFYSAPRHINPGADDAIA